MGIIILSNQNLVTEIYKFLKISKNQKMVWENAFKFFDADNSGEISYSEFEAKMKSCNVSATQAAKLPALFKEGDKDGSGEIDKNEFENMLNTRCKQIFDKIDADGSGNISPSELKAAVNSTKVAAFIKAADKDGDGEISLSEFSSAIASNPKEFLEIAVSVNV